MRRRVNPKLKAKNTPVSLYPAQVQFATKRVNSIPNLSLSRYVQRLIDLDRSNPELLNAFVLRQNEAEMAKFAAVVDNQN